MRSWLIILLVLSAPLIFVGCPDDDDDSVGDDDDASGGEPALCDISPGCASDTTNCPSTAPDTGDECTFVGNCHYCNDENAIAEGYSCDGIQFSFQGTFTCD